MDVKLWAKCPPSVGAVRPARCPVCGAPGASAHGPVGLHGHGLRIRTLLGPLAPGEPPQRTVLWLRRYQCQRCGALVMAAPRGLLPRRRYGAVAIALALSLWGTTRLPGHRVRDKVSPRPSVGNEALHGFQSLRRWARQVGAMWPFLRIQGASSDARARARQATQQLAAWSPIPTGRIWIDACAGAVHGR